jgi:hypothetical protein
MTQSFYSADDNRASDPARPEGHWLRWWADLLDSRFAVPGTSIRFGLDPILALVPGVGDLASPVYTLVLLVEGLRLRVPPLILTRMVLNALFDALIGAVPLGGAVADIFWRANNRNLALLEQHARPGQPLTTADYLFVFAIAAVFGVLAIVPVVLGLWLTMRMFG